MIRALLSLSLCGLILCLGILTCVLQCSNHERASALAARQRQLELLTTSNAQAQARVSAHVWGVSDSEEALSSHAPGRRGAKRPSRGVSVP